MVPIVNDGSARTEALILEGMKHQREERFGEAERAYRAVLQLDRTNPKALALMGTLAGMHGNFQMAIDLFLRALPRDPDNADLYHNLGETYRLLGETGKAIPSFSRALQLRPDHLESYRSAADAALDAAHKASNPDHARELRRMAVQYLLKLGTWQHRRRLLDTEKTLREAAQLESDNAEALYALGSFLQERNLSSEAATLLRRATEINPKNAEFHNNLGSAFYALQQWPEAEQAFGRAAELDANFQQNLVSTRLMPLLYDDKVTVERTFEQHCAWGAEITAQCRETVVPTFTNTRDPNRRLRVAYLSGDFNRHPVGFFFAPLLAHHDHKIVDVFCYSEIESPDATTQSLQTLGGIWRQTRGMSDEALRQQLRADQIDIAIDLAGHTARNRLRALAIKPAPVTATWLGYPATTGLPSIDWRITDALADPPGQEHFHTEKLMRLPNGLWCYEPPIADMPEVAPPPALTRGYVTFGSFNNPAKISTATIRAWAAILAAVPRSRLLLKGMILTDAEAKRRLLDQLKSAGLETDRVDIRGSIDDLKAHFAAYGDVDIALDPFPYNGTTTTCEALWMGVPVVALIGNHHAARVGFDLLSRLGLVELAAIDIDAYVATAVALAQDMTRLQYLRSRLRERMRASPLCDAVAFARAFEAALREMWRHWCDEPRTTVSQ